MTAPIWRNAYKGGADTKAAIYSVFGGRDDAKVGQLVRYAICRLCDQ